MGEHERAYNSLKLKIATENGLKTKMLIENLIRMHMDLFPRRNRLSTVVVGEQVKREIPMVQ